MSQLLNDTLSAWLLIESLSPGEVNFTAEDILSAENFKNGAKQAQLQSFDEYFEIWNDERFIISEEKSEIGEIIFKFYRHCFRYNEINLKIQDIFDDYSDIHNPNGTHCYGYTFNIDKHGQVIVDSIHIPMIMSALKEIEKNKNANIEEKFNDSVEKFVQKVKEILADEPINEFKLKKMDIAYDEYFSVLNSKKDGLFAHYVAIEYVKDSDLPQPEFNSFFISDIEKARKSPNQTLIDYIEGVEESKRIEVDENKEMFDKFLHPSRLPDGRWPSQTEFRLSLMQQLAVNQITSGNERISSVNGPPGTGKTTLLKDIFAHLVVERGKELAKLNNPKDAFVKTKTHETDDKYVYLLKESIAKYKMVVASSNNGAVENISKDLPKIEEIIRNPEKCKFPKYEQNYANLAHELKDFAEIAEDLIGESAWGLFSGVFGKSTNINQVLSHMLKQDANDIGFAKLLQNENNRMSYNELMSEWQSHQRAFLEELRHVEMLKEESIRAYDVYKNCESYSKVEHELNSKKMNVKEKLNHLEIQISCDNKEIEDLDDRINYNTKQLETLNELIKSIRDSNKGFVNKLKAIFNSEEDERYKKHNAEKQQLLGQQIELEKCKKIKNEDLVSKLKEKEKLIKQLTKVQLQLDELNSQLQELEAYRIESKITIPEKDFWSDNNYDERQVTNLWTSDELQYRRAMLFLRAMILHKLLLIANNTTIYYAINDFKSRRKLIDANPDKVHNAWNVMHLIFPVVSTTFASFKSMYGGIPLWVHRRCLKPMFTIANQIAYNNKMVLPSNITNVGKTGWYDVKGNSVQKQFVKEHGEKVLELLANDWFEAIKEGKNEPSSFVISPFSAVQKQVKRILKQQLPTRIDIERTKINQWVDKSIGTVHTFQGKEAQKVYFVIGTDNTQDGAVNWSCEKPNLLNVAVTRAKKEFYVIGDMQRIQSKPFYETIFKERNVK